MLRTAKKLFSSFFKLKSFPILVPVRQNIIVQSPNLKWYSSSKPTKLNLNINEQLLACKNTQDLLQIYKRFKDVMNLVNYSVLLKQVNEYQTVKKESGMEQYSNEILKIIFLKLQRELVHEARLVASLYFHINRYYQEPSDYLTRCNFFLESQGLKLYKQMTTQEINNFVYTLGQNKKADIIKVLLPYISENLPKYNFRTITTILYSISNLDIKAPDFARKFQDYFISSRESSKITAHDYSLLFYYCGKNHEVMNSPKFFSKLDDMAIFQMSYCKGIGVSNIFHSLTFYEKPIMSSKFYQNFEPHILNLLSQLSDQALSLILRGYSIFGFGSERFYQEFMKEAHKRVNNLDPETFSTIFFHLSNKKSVSKDFINAFTERVGTSKLEGFATKQFEHIFYGFSNLSKEGLLEFPFADIFLSYITKHIYEFTLQELGNIAFLCAIFPANIQVLISLQMQERLNNEQDVPLQTEDFKGLCEITYFVLIRCANSASKNCIEKIINVCMCLTADYETFKELAKKVYPRYYGKLLYALAVQDKLETSYVAKREQLVRTFEKFLLETYDDVVTLTGDFTLDAVVMHLIKSFYLVLEKPSEGIKGFWRKAIACVGKYNFAKGDLDFLTNKTDLLIDQDDR